MHRTLCSGILLLVTAFCCQAQYVELFTDTVYGCRGDTLEISLNTTGFLDVGSMTLFVHYNPQEVTYDTCTAMHPMLPNLLVNHYLAPNPTIGFSWFTPNMSPVNLGTDTIARLRFILHTDSALISLSPLCEVTNATGTPLPAQFRSSPILPFEIPVSQQPQNVMVPVPGQASFSLTPDQIQLAVQWQKSLNQTEWFDIQDNVVYSGTNTTTLWINVTDDSLFTYTYRCAYRFGNCEAYSELVWLIKDTVQDIFLPDNKHLNLLSPYPNPVVDNITIPLNGSDAKSITFALMDMAGILHLSREVTINPSAVAFHTQLSGIHPGVYMAVVTYHYPNHFQRVQKHIIFKK